MKPCKIFYATILMLFFSCKNDSESSSVKLKRVVRFPNSLEYSDKPFTKEELLIAQWFLRKDRIKHKIDSTGQIYLPKYGNNYGESINMFMWMLSENVEDSIKKKY